MFSLRPDFDIVGTVKGSWNPQVNFCMERLRELGVKWLAFPCSELVRERDLSNILTFINHAKKHQLGGWIIGLGSPRLMRKLNADCYSTSKWC